MVQPLPELGVAGFVPISRVNGPGRRAVLWVQGCSLNCPGCFNPGTHAASDTATPGEALIDQLLRAREAGAEAVTFSGGEPFQQAEALAALCARLAQVWPEAHRMAYTGYRFETLVGAEAPAGAQALLAQLDMVVDGRYDPRQAQPRPWRASRNQRVWVVGRPPPRWSAPPDAELHVSPTGQVLLSGLPDARLRNAVARLST